MFEKENIMNTWENRVILSAVLPSEGGQILYRLTKEQAQKWLKKGPYKNFVGHETVRLLGIEPAAERTVCGDDWGQALVIKPKGRLERGREYSAEEIEEIGYEIWLIVTFSHFEWGYEGLVGVTETPNPYRHENPERPTLRPPVPTNGTLSGFSPWLDKWLEEA
jgi:hypothetical protein